jgi:hypothetical protein
LTQELIRLRILILCLPVDPLLEIHDVKDLKVAIARLAMFQFVDIPVSQFKPVEIR